MASLSSSPASVSYLAYDTAHEEDNANNNSIVTKKYSRSHRYPSSVSKSVADTDNGPITLAEFVDALPRILHRQKEEDRAHEFSKERIKQDGIAASSSSSSSSTSRGTDDDPVNVLFRRLDLSLGEWKKYALFDPMKNYTRNLIATDDETYTLLLLCWNPSKESPIHDHP